MEGCQQRFYYKSQESLAAVSMVLVSATDYCYEHRCVCDGPTAWIAVHEQAWFRGPALSRSRKFTLSQYCGEGLAGEGANVSNYHNQANVCFILHELSGSGANTLSLAVGLDTLEVKALEASPVLRKQRRDSAFINYSISFL